MRVAIDARWNYHGGVRTYVSNLLRALPQAAAARGISILAYEHPSRPISTSHPNLTKIALRNGCYSPVAQYELAMRARRDKLAILHTPFYFDAFLVDCPTVITIHDLIPFIFPVYGFVHRETVKAAYRFSARCSTHIVTVSDSTEQDVVRLLGVPGGKVTTVHNGLDQDVFKPARCPDEATFLSQRYGIRRPYVLTMSASNWKTKNIEGTLRAIENARDISSAQFQTVVIGSPTGLEQTGLRGKLRDTLVTGPVPAPDLPKIYRNASVFISLSRYEGFGYPLAEAMSCGTPCITSSGGSLAEIAADGAIVVDGSDESKVAQVLADLLANSERRKMLSQKAVNRASAFALGTFAESLLDVYQKVYQHNHWL